MLSTSAPIQHLSTYSAPTQHLSTYSAPTQHLSTYSAPQHLLSTSAPVQHFSVLGASTYPLKESTCLIKNRKICHRITIINDTERHVMVCAPLCNKLQNNHTHRLSGKGTYCSKPTMGGGIHPLR
jgi:hypothetical protein